MQLRQGICILTSIAGTLFNNLGASHPIMGALYKGLISTGVLSLVGVVAAIWCLVDFGQIPGVAYSGMSLSLCVVGLAVTGFRRLERVRE